MPRKYPANKKGAKKRVYKRKNRMNRIPRQMGAFSNQQLVSLRYGTQLTLNSTSIGTYGTHSFRANDIFDPDFTGTGHQPRGFDQWAQFYDNYVVLGSKIRVHCQNAILEPQETAYTNGEHNQSYICISLTEDQESSAGDIHEMLESRKFTYRALDSNKNTTYLTKTYSAKKFLGIKNVMEHSPLIANVTGHPQQEVFYNITGFSGNGNTVISARLNLIVVIEYIVMFKNRKVLPES